MSVQATESQRLHPATLPNKRFQAFRDTWTQPPCFTDKETGLGLREVYHLPKATLLVSEMRIELWSLGSVLFPEL